MAFPEGKSTFNAPPQSSIYWENEENVVHFISELKEKFDNIDNTKILTRKN